MYYTYKQIFRQINDIMQDILINGYLLVRLIEENLPDRKNIINFLILKYLNWFQKEYLIIEQKIQSQLLAIIKHDKFRQLILNQLRILQANFQKLNHIFDSYCDDYNILYLFKKSKKQQFLIILNICQINKSSIQFIKNFMIQINLLHQSIYYTTIREQYLYQLLFITQNKFYYPFLLIASI
ncbi:unnamed protein product [Paramecium sonneborni]|uniref:Uncharacterized protein n=1 Tax=Paramecium sonneborni TaxID=65129 RepID=A0A8S1MIS8_9CILI|nr:unnamed protein product [Paramecium sonneborni]